MANILILGSKIPFTRGGQDVLVGSLMRELKKKGHEVDLVELPFTPFPKEGLVKEAALWRSIDLGYFSGRQVDLVIATKFPTYYAKHPRKSLWLVHQHRPIYDLYGTRFSDFSDDPRDEALRQILAEGDRKMISECRYISGISENVINRLNKYNGLRGEVLYPPLPLGDRYISGAQQDYILSVGRLCSIKRVELLLRAMPSVYNFIKLKIVGLPDEENYLQFLKNEIEKHNLSDRVEFLGRVTDENLIKLYSEALCVYYAPFDEDYGYVTLEAMASGRPVITAKDSGGVLEFVEDKVTGVIADPTAEGIGQGINLLVENRELAKQLGEAGSKRIKDIGLYEAGWDKVVNGLLSPLSK